MPATSASFGVHSEAGAELPEEPCSKSLQPPSREAFSFTTRYDVTFKSFSHKSPSPSRTPKTLHFKLGDYKQRPLGLRNCSRVSSGPHKHPAPIIRLADSSSLRGEYGSYRPRNTTYARERSYPCGSPGRVTSRVCEFNFSSSQRPVVNLRPLNQFIPYEHFKMEGIHMLRDLLRKGGFMAKIDLKDAYFTVPVWRNNQKFLRFVWKETMYEFACLPFGLASAPRVFTKLMKPVVGLLRQLGIRLIIYLDDMLIMAQSRDIALQHASLP